MIKGIIFDMDGVMIDTENQSNLGWLWAASQKNVEMPLWLIDSFKGAPAKLSQSFFDDYYHGEQDYWEMRTMRTDHVYKIRETEEVPVKPGLHMLLDYIKDNGLKCAVATSTHALSAPLARTIAKRPLATGENCPGANMTSCIVLAKRGLRTRFIMTLPTAHFPSYDWFPASHSIIAASISMSEAV